MVRVSFRVFGRDGHRQRASFGKSFAFEFLDGTGRCECHCEDMTYTNEYVDVVITAGTFKECAEHLNSQLSDGIFENCNVGKILISRIEKKKSSFFEPIPKNETLATIYKIKKYGLI